MAKHVDQFLAVVNQHRRAALDHQVGGGDVFPQALLDVVKHVAHLFELDAGVEQALDHLQLEQVPVAVAPA